MKNAPLFSIVIPHYNDLDGLKSCLEGISRLDFPSAEVEVIVVDDCSPVRIDESSLQASFPEVRILRQPSNLGPAAARNRGAAVAIGQYIAFIDSDACPDSSWLACYRAELGKGYDVVCGPVRHEETFLARLTALTAFGEYLQPGDGYRQHCPSVNFVIAASLMRRFSYDESFAFAGEDVVFSTQLRLAGYAIRYLAGAWVRHSPRLTLRTYFRRAFLYGEGFCPTRSRCPDLAGFGLHRRLGAFSALPLFFIRAGLDIVRLVRLRHLLSLTPFNFPVFVAGILCTRACYAAGVVRGYSSGGATARAV